ncbi:MAG: hypothetical protein P8Y64_04770 [Gammaproteobacteria bacterium]|jgi:hypothetical protein
MSSIGVAETGGGLSMARVMITVLALISLALLVALLVIGHGSLDAFLMVADGASAPTVTLVLTAGGLAAISLGLNLYLQYCGSRGRLLSLMLILAMLPVAFSIWSPIHYNNRKNAQLLATVQRHLQDGAGYQAVYDGMKACLDWSLSLQYWPEARRRCALNVAYGSDHRPDVVRALRRLGLPTRE